jgi:tRNA A37 threonylcarbamoyltransferase TsaD
MIAWNGLLAWKSGQRTKFKNSGVVKDWRTDEVDVNWL